MSKAATRERKPIVRKGFSIKPRPLAPVEAPAPLAPGEKPACRHRWVLESPSGAMSLGKCRVCGAEKEFPNSAEDYLWERDVPQSRWTGRSEVKATDISGAGLKGY